MVKENDAPSLSEFIPNSIKHRLSPKIILVLPAKLLKFPYHVILKLQAKLLMFPYHVLMLFWQKLIRLIRLIPKILRPAIIQFVRKLIRNKTWLIIIIIMSIFFLYFGYK